jgi:uncharacterized protein (DUF58 family)
MRTSSLLLFFVLWVAALGCKPTPPDPQAEWVSKEADLGPVKQGAEVEHAFVFTNVGRRPLLIREVTPSCGCTAVNWTRRPVGPGEQGEIRVRYKATGETTGVALKHVTVFANTRPDFTNLFVKANIVL